MLHIPCPHCGDRDAVEFAYIGERVARPDVDSTSPQEWRGYLYLRRNRAGWSDELWLHRAGCGKYLAVTRDTRTNQIEDCRLITFGRPGNTPTGTQTSWGGAEPAERDRTTGAGEGG